MKVYIIQNIKNNKYIKHDGTEDMFQDFPFYYVDTPEDAEQYTTFDHAEYVAFWHTDISQKWRIIDLETGESYISHKNNTRRYIRENKDAAMPHGHRDVII